VGAGLLSDFTVFPAIDLRGGRCVRLVQGDFGRAKEYDADPVERAREWERRRARALHVVDLDGARDGKPVNLEHLERIAARAGVPVQFGGGLRTVEAVLDAVGAGADRVVIGTVAFTEPDVLDRMIERGGERVRIAVDVRDGVVATGGWLSSTSISAPDAVSALRDRGAGGFIYTSVDRDGTMQGPDLESLARVCEAARGGPVIYSGGIGELSDLEALAALPAPEMSGVIVGKALYERRFSITEARLALGEEVA
jgi:phosphoribosylformimino-5-aminoimidazole carboxamide ribotide isomerase